MAVCGWAVAAALGFLPCRQVAIALRAAALTRGLVLPCGWLSALERGFSGRCASRLRAIALDAKGKPQLFDSVLSR